MFNLLAQYIGYRTEAESKNFTKSPEDCSLGVVEEEEWTLVNIPESCHLGGGVGPKEESYQRVAPPAPLESLSRSITKSGNARNVDTHFNVAQEPGRRVRNTKMGNKHHLRVRKHSQHHPKQMKRYNQVFSQRSSKVHQKMRQILHQPKKF